MSQKPCRKRQLASESLEERQLLHGGGFGSAGFGGAGLGGLLGPPTIDQYVEAVFDRYDQTEDGVLDQADELSDRVKERLADADANEDGGITTDELTEYLESARVSKLLGLDESRGLCGIGGGGDVEDRVELAVEVVDDDGEGDIDQSEVSVKLWEELATGDTDKDASLSSDELVVLVETADAEREAALIANAVDALLEKYDQDDDSAINMSEVSDYRWHRLANADANADDSISQEELTQYVTDQIAEREAYIGHFGWGPGRYFGRWRR